MGEDSRLACRQECLARARCCHSDFGLDRGESDGGPLGAHLLLSGPKGKPRTLRALDTGIILRLLAAPAPPSQGPGHLAVTSADPERSHLHPDCFP